MHHHIFFQGVRYFPESERISCSTWLVLDQSRKSDGVVMSSKVGGAFILYCVWVRCMVHSSAPISKPFQDGWKGYLRRFCTNTLKSSKFDAAVGVVIVANSICIGVRRFSYGNALVTVITQVSRAHARMYVSHGLRKHHGAQQNGL